MKEHEKWWKLIEKTEATTTYLVTLKTGVSKTIVLYGTTPHQLRTFESLPDCPIRAPGQIFCRTITGKIV